MKNYKIVKDKKTYEIPTKDIISRYKNFNKLQIGYEQIIKRQKIPLYKNKKVFLFLLIIALIAYLVFTA